MRAEYPTAHSSKLICASRSRHLLLLHGWVRCDSPHQQGVGPQIISMGCTPNIALIDRVLTLPPRYPCRLNRLPASRFLPPRSGLERSDFVPWHLSDIPARPLNCRYWGISNFGIAACVPDKRRPLVCELINAPGRRTRVRFTSKADKSLHRSEMRRCANAQSRCAPARCAGAGTERPVAG